MKHHFYSRNEISHFWQNMVEDKGKGRGEGQESHQCLIHHQTFQAWQHPQKFCIATKIFTGVCIEQ